MKNMVKLIGLIALAAIISFSALSLTGCDDGSGGGGGGNPTAPTITTSSLPDGNVGTAYTATLTARGSVPITWSLSGTLPDGLSLSGNTISGTPTAEGTSTFTVTATNAVGSNDKELSITIARGGESKETAIPLTENQWEDGNLPTSNDQQWFSFTATASTQYIHFSFGTLTEMYAQVYTSSGTAVGSETLLYSYNSTRSVSRPLTSGQTYYIMVKSNSSDSSGAYRIAFNTTICPPGVIPLTENQWEDGNLPTPSDQQWFSFTATANTQWIHVSLGTLTYLHVQLYDSGGTAVGSETWLYSSSPNTSQTLTEGQTYYIRVRPSDSRYSGTYKIAFNTTFMVPGGQPLTENQWKDGNLPGDGEQWFSFTATATTQYIHVSFGTLTSLWVRVSDSSGTTVGSETSFNNNISRTLTSGDTYYIRVRPYSSDYSGTYKIAFNTSETEPNVELPSNAIPLTVNQWADGNLPTSRDQQWFSFTATATTQYIHASLGTLTSLWVRVYDSSGITVGSETRLSDTGSNLRTSRTLTSGDTYYIRVRPYSSSYSGTYKIGFTTSTTAPTSP